MKNTGDLSDPNRCPRGVQNHEEDVEDSQALTHEEQTQRLAELASWVT